jgi:hypothetical protein
MDFVAFMISMLPPPRGLCPDAAATWPGLSGVSGMVGVKQESTLLPAKEGFRCVSSDKFGMDVFSILETERFADRGTSTMLALVDWINTGVAGLMLD